VLEAADIDEVEVEGEDQGGEDQPAHDQREHHRRLVGAGDPHRGEDRAGHGVGDGPDGGVDLLRDGGFGRGCGGGVLGLDPGSDGQPKQAGDAETNEHP